MAIPLDAAARPRPHTLGCRRPPPLRHPPGEPKRWCVRRSPPAARFRRSGPRLWTSCSSPICCQPARNQAGCATGGCSRSAPTSSCRWRGVRVAAVSPVVLAAAAVSCAVPPPQLLKNRAQAFCSRRSPPVLMRSRRRWRSSTLPAVALWPAAAVCSLRQTPRERASSKLRRAGLKLSCHSLAGSTAGSVLQMALQPMGFQPPVYPHPCLAVARGSKRGRGPAPFPANTRCSRACESAFAWPSSPSLARWCRPMRRGAHAGAYHGRVWCAMTRHDCTSVPGVYPCPSASLCLRRARQSTVLPRGRRCPRKRALAVGDSLAIERYLYRVDGTDVSGFSA